MERLMGLHKMEGRLGLIIFKIIDDKVRYSSDANTLLTLAKVLQMAYHAVRSPVIYTDAFKDWQREPIAENAWAVSKQISC